MSDTDLGGKSKTMEPLIYKYGLLDPLDWGPDCAEQLYRNNRLWNNLVEIERAQRKRYLNLVDSQAEVFQMKASRDVLWEERKTLIKQRKKAAQSARRRVDVPDITNRLRQIKTELDSTKDAFKAARAAAALVIKPEAEKLDSERKEAVKKVGAIELDEIEEKVKAMKTRAQPVSSCESNAAQARDENHHPTSTGRAIRKTQV